MGAGPHPHGSRRGLHSVAPPGLEDNAAASANPQSAIRNPQSPPIRLLKAPDPRSEVDAVARDVRELLRQGYRLRDVAVLVRDLSGYHTLIDTTFREHGLPYFVDRRRSAAHHPLLQFVRSIFQIARGSWPHPAVMTFLKSGLAGVSLLEADEIENYLLQHRLRGRAWDDAEEWRFQRSLSADEDPDAPPPQLFETRSIDLLRRQIVDRLRPLLALARGSAPVAVRELAAEVFAVFERFGVRGTLSRWMAEASAAGDLEQRGEHEQVWAELVDLFEQMVDLLGDETVTPGDFVDVLESGLERFDLALTPPTVDQVLVGQVDRTRTPAVRAAFVLGLNEGSFPATARDASLLSHVERRELRRRNMDLDPDPQRRQLDERFLAYVAFTCPSERLTVSRPLVDGDGNEATPSAYWGELRRVAPAAEPVVVSRETGTDVRQIATPRQLVTCLMKWAADVGAHGRVPSDGDDAAADRTHDRASLQGTVGAHGGVPSSPSADARPDAGGTRPCAPTDARPTLYHWFAAHSRSLTTARVDHIRFRAWAAQSYRNQPALSPAVAKQLFPAPLKATASQLETHAACPFRHFLRHGIRLAGREAHDVTALDMSHVFHEVLEIVAAEVLGDGKDWTDLTPKEAENLIRTYTTAVAERLRGEVMLSTARGKYLLGRIERTLDQVVASVKEMVALGTFRPAHAGVAFGEGKRLPAYAIPTPGGAEVRLSGQIDRVDVVSDGADAGAVAVFDYKLAGGPLSVGGVVHGLSLQLLTSLLVLEAAGQELAGRPVTPAAAFYFQLLRGLQQVDHPDEAVDPNSAEFRLRHKPRGVFDSRFLQALDAMVSPGEKSKVVNASIKKDGQIGDMNRSDAADAQAFTGLLSFVRTRLGQIADEVMSGRIDAAPYRIGKVTPCPRCEYRPVCRFEPMANGYRHLVPLKRSDALDRAGGKARGGRDD